MVWYNDRLGNDDVWARRVARDGTSAGPAFYISVGSGAERSYPNVAYNPQRNEYLVVWEQQDSHGFSVRGQRVSDTGNLIDVEIVFASNPNATTNCQQPAVAYATTKDRYLLVFRYDN
ncbi:MAG TPA: hypothetical protein ENL34_08770, partial [Chloroflexi bacterium]|nr:hypothetical protein [Chloroflexota bacterium]